MTLSDVQQREAILDRIHGLRLRANQLLTLPLNHKTAAQSRLALRDVDEAVEWLLVLNGIDSVAHAMIHFLLDIASFRLDIVTSAASVSTETGALHID
ncbi:MAG TPA: hypothetical protein VGJ29_10640 [Vicinamibacterales bacterium]|jgi:hypothetical protein